MTRVTHGTCLGAWPATPPARDGAYGHFRRPISMRLSPVASSLPPLHNLDNFYFWAKIKHHFKPYALIPIVGDSDSPCADQWCSDSYSKEAKHTKTQYLTWFGKTAYNHGRESILFRDRERIQYKYMEEEDHFTQTQLPTLTHCCTCSCCNGSNAAAIAALSFSLLSLHSYNPLHILLSKNMPLL